MGDPQGRNQGDDVDSRSQLTKGLGTEPAWDMLGMWRLTLSKTFILFDEVYMKYML